MEKLSRYQEIEIVKAILEKYQIVKVSDVQRRIKKGYIYTAKLIEDVKNNDK